MNQEILSFAKNMGKSLSSKYGQERFDGAKKSTTGATKTASKRAIQKTAEATGDLIGNKIADKITSVSKRRSANNNDDDNDDNDIELTTHKKDIYLHKKGSKLLIINEG